MLSLFFFFLAGTFPPPSFFSPPLLSLEPALFFLKRRRKVKRGATCSLCFFFPPSLSFRQGRCRAETLPSSLFAASLAELDKRERAERKNKNSSFRRSSNDAPTTNNGRRRPRLLLPSAAPVVASVQALSSLPTRQREALFPWTPSHKTIAHQSPARLFALEDDDALFTWFHSSFGPVPQMSDQMERVRLLLRALFTPLSLSCFPGRERIHSRDPLLPKTLPQSTRERGHLFEFSK